MCKSKMALPFFYPHYMLHMIIQKQLIYYMKWRANINILCFKYFSIYTIVNTRITVIESKHTKNHFWAIRRDDINDFPKDIVICSMHVPSLLIHWLPPVSYLWYFEVVFRPSFCLLFKTLQVFLTTWLTGIYKLISWKRSW